MLMFYMAMLEDEGQRRRFFQLYQGYYDKMMAVARKYFPGDQHTAEDAVHESFLKIIENFEKISEISCEKLPGYIVIIVKNCCIDILRRQKRLVLTDDWRPYEEATVQEAGDGFSNIVSLIRSLPETYRAALEMRFVLEMEYEEIAKALGISESAVASRINRGRKLLIKAMEKEGIVP